jgi:hypothetical protein
MKYFDTYNEKDDLRIIKAIDVYENLLSILFDKNEVVIFDTDKNK